MFRPSRATFRAFSKRFSHSIRSFGSGRTRHTDPSRVLVPLSITFALLYIAIENNGARVIREVNAEEPDNGYRQEYDRIKNEVKQHYKLDPAVLSVESFDKANEVLERIGQSQQIDGIRVDTCSLPSNSLLGEDRYACSVKDYTLPGGTRERLVTFSIFDGHAGHATADVLQASLNGLVMANIAKLYEGRTPDVLGAKPGNKEIEQAIVSSFLHVDGMIMGNAEAALEDARLPPRSSKAIGYLAPALSGSCALMALFEPSTSMLRVACVGDSRAVLGRAHLSGQYSAIPMSVDQTGFNPSEVTRITSEHPSNERIIDAKTGRIHGLAVSRAFGDARWKWTGEACRPLPRYRNIANNTTDEMMKDAAQRFWAHGPRPGGVVKTPPYLTALPDVKHIKVEDDTALPDFLIMASDGFWDIFSNENAVQCVQQWVEAKRKGYLDHVDRNIAHEQLRAERQQGAQLDQDLFDHEDGSMEWKVEPAHFTVEDGNCATHLLRNALGGTRRSLFCAALEIAPPLSRDVRDDISIHVIFFGKV